MCRVCAQVVALVGGVAALTFPVAAQDDGGPIVVGERDEKLQFFQLTDISAALEFRWEHRYNKQAADGQTTIEETSDTLLETLNLSTRSYFGHPNLIDLSASGQIGWQDLWVDRSPGEGQHDSSLFDTYDITAGILSRGPAPLTLFARRSESLVDREFGGTLDSTTEEYGASLFLFREVVPTRLGYTHRRQQLDDPFNVSSFDLMQDTLSLHSDLTISPYQRMVFDYAFDHYDEDRGIGDPRVFDQHNALLTHTLTFGPQHNNNLRSALRYFRQEAEVLQELWHLDEALFLTHSDTLDSRYSLAVDRRESDDQRQDLVRGSALLRHRLYESLVTTVSGGGSHQSVDDFTSDEVFGRLAFDYTKRVPYGLLTAQLVGALNRTDNSEQGDPVMILGQRETFDDPDPVVLSHRNIENSSIVVTDANRARVYREGIDYTVRVLPDRVEIFRITGGDIGPMEEVLVDYTVGPEPANTTLTRTLGGSGRYAFNDGPLRGLGVYGSYTDSRQDISSDGYVDFIPDNLQLLRYGVDYQLGNFFLLAEMENRDSTISPSDTLRFQARYFHGLGPRSRVSLEYSYQQSDYHEEDRTTELHRVTGRWIQTITPDLDLRLRLVYRDERSSFAGDTQGFDQDLEINWRRNQTSLFASINNSFLEGNDVENTSQTIIVGLRRSF
ncbi:MAG: hypothetical protein KDA21_11930 [Phycisphaerales bacterium]|nr:hypothetical protein [Phycisphaerales bacterium]